MPLKIAIIGAGSLGFTRLMMRDILTVPEFADTEFSLMDTNARNLGMIEQLCRREIKTHQLPAKIETTTNLQKAVAGADYVYSVIRQGGLEAFQTDIDIPLKYGVDQCVGDTLCAGGLMYAQRTIPALLEICQAIREESPDALFLNHSNPMAMNTWACNKYGGVKTIGLCHGVHWAQMQIIECIEIWAKEKKLLGKYDKIEEKDVDFIAAGINHQTWFLKIDWNGVDFIPLLLEYMEKHPLFPQKEKVRIDVLRRFGYYSTESNGHLSEYLPWYRKRVNEIKDWAFIGDWICGETGGYLRVSTEGRHWFKTEFPLWLKEEVKPLTPEYRTSEHGSYIVEALETGRIYRGHLNMINRGNITNLPDGCVIEIPGYVDGTGVNMPVIGDLPLACAATCAASIRVQEMGMEAAVHGDVMLLKQAMLHDPLVGAVCNPEEVWQMTDELLVAQQCWLPQYKGEIRKAEARLKKHVKDGTRMKLSKSKGAARLKVRNNQELARDAAAYHAGLKKEADKFAREKAAYEKRMAKSQ